MPAISLTHDERTALQQAVSRYMAHHNNDPALFLGGKEIVTTLAAFQRLKTDRPIPLSKKQAALALTALRAETPEALPARAGLETKLEGHSA